MFVCYQQPFSLYIVYLWQMYFSPRATVIVIYTNFHIDSIKYTAVKVFVTNIHVWEIAQNET